MRTTMLVAFSWTALAGLITASGCRSTVRGEGEGAGSTREEAAKILAAAECEKSLECMPFRTKVTFGEQPECEAEVGPFEVYLLTLPDITSSPDDILQCAAALKAASCSEFVNATFAGCDFVGTRQDGEPCAGDAQCQSGYCDNPWTGECGVCATLGAIGEACTGDPSLYECALGAHCSYAQKCVATPLNVGDACPDYYCGEILRCESGVCAALLDEGAECGSSLDCDWPNGLLCDSDSFTCVQGHVAAPGESCAEPHTSCEALGICDGTTKKCVARPKAGEACLADGTCASNTHCVNGTCETVPFTCN